MQRQKHKHKMNHLVIVTSDGVDANVKQYRVKPAFLWTVILILSVVIGAMIGYFVYEGQLWDVANRKAEQLSQTISEQELQLQRQSEEREQLKKEIEGLNEQVQLLSNELTQKVERESVLTAQLEKQTMPTEFPLSGAAQMEENTSDNQPILIFHASLGTSVLATAGGTVTAVNDDAEYGHNVWVDHGNGYVTIYRNQGDAMVKVGDNVVQGTSLFMISDENALFGYQMMKDGVYIDPMEMLAISG